MSKHPRIFTLNEPNAPRLNPALAAEVGLNESLVLLQIEFYISISRNERDGRRWTYQSAKDIKEKAFDFWSVSTINRAINNLIEKGYIIEGNYNEKKYDKTRWFALNFEKLSELNSISINGQDHYESSEGKKVTHEEPNNDAIVQNESRSNQNESRSNQNDKPIPETSTETTTENIYKSIINRIEKENFEESTKYILMKNQNRLIDDDVNILDISKTYETYKNKISTELFNIILDRVLITTNGKINNVSSLLNTSIVNQMHVKKEKKVNNNIPHVLDWSKEHEQEIERVEREKEERRKKSESEPFDLEEIDNLIKSVTGDNASKNRNNGGIL